jgi:hypothetical protein
MLSSTQADRPKRRFHIGLTAATAALILLVVYWLTKGGLHKLFSTEDWVHFTVPENALPLDQAEIRTSPEIITICNRSTERWSELLIQLDSAGEVSRASEPKGPPTYLVKLKYLDAGKCKGIAIEDFAEPSWKHMRAFRGLQITKVEVLANITRRAYAVQPVRD